MKRIFILLLILGFILSGCNNKVADPAYNDESIILSNDSYTFDTFTNTLDGTVYQANGTMSGAITLWEMDVEQPFELSVTYSLSVLSEGNANLVLITPTNDTVYFAITENDKPEPAMQDKALTPSFLLEDMGNYKIKLVTSADTQFEVMLDVPVGEFRKE